MVVVAGGRVLATVPETKTGEPALFVVRESVMVLLPLVIVTGDPALSVCPDITYAVLEPLTGVYVVPPMVRAGAEVITVCCPAVAAAGRVDVTPFTITAEPLGAREIVVPETVITPPGVRVWPPMV